MSIPRPTSLSPRLKEAFDIFALDFQHAGVTKGTMGCQVSIVADQKRGGTKQAPWPVSRRFVHVVNSSSQPLSNTSVFYAHMMETISDLLEARFVRLLEPVKATGKHVHRMRVAAARGQVWDEATDLARVDAIVDVPQKTSILGTALERQMIVQVNSVGRDPRFCLMVDGDGEGDMLCGPVFRRDGTLVSVVQVFGHFRHKPKTGAPPLETLRRYLKCSETFLV